MAANQVSGVSALEVITADELWIEILNWLDLPSIASFAAVCTVFQRLASDALLLKRHKPEFAYPLLADIFPGDKDGVVYPSLYPTPKANAYMILQACQVGYMHFVDESLLIPYRQRVQVRNALLLDPFTDPHFADGMPHPAHLDAIVRIYTNSPDVDGLEYLRARFAATNPMPLDECLQAAIDEEACQLLATLDWYARLGYVTAETLIKAIDHEYVFARLSLLMLANGYVAQVSEVLPENQVSEVLLENIDMNVLCSRLFNIEVLVPDTALDLLGPYAGGLNQPASTITFVELPCFSEVDIPVFYRALYSYTIACYEQNEIAMLSKITGWLIQRSRISLHTWGITAYRIAIFAAKHCDVSADMLSTFLNRHILDLTADEYNKLSIDDRSSNHIMIRLKLIQTLMLLELFKVLVEKGHRPSVYLLVHFDFPNPDIPVSVKQSVAHMICDIIEKITEDMDDCDFMRYLNRRGFMKERHEEYQTTRSIFLSLAEQPTIVGIIFKRLIAPRNIPDFDSHNRYGGDMRYLFYKCDGFKPSMDERAYRVSIACMQWMLRTSPTTAVVADGGSSIACTSNGCSNNLSIER